MLAITTRHLFRPPRSKDESALPDRRTSDCRLSDAGTSVTAKRSSLDNGLMDLAWLYYPTWSTTAAMPRRDYTKRHVFRPDLRIFRRLSLIWWIFRHNVGWVVHH